MGAAKNVVVCDGVFLGELGLRRSPRGRYLKTPEEVMFLLKSLPHTDRRKCRKALFAAGYKALAAVKYTPKIDGKTWRQFCRDVAEKAVR